jgi:hypothetical protein
VQAVQDVVEEEATGDIGGDFEGLGKVWAKSGIGGSIASLAQQGGNFGADLADL